MRKFIFGLLALAIVVFGGVFYLLGRDYNKTLVKDNPNTVQSSSSVATSSESISSSESVSSSSSSEAAVPSSLRLSGVETDQFASWIVNQAAKMNRVGSELGFEVSSAYGDATLYYDTVNGPLYLNGDNGGAGLQAQAVYGFYKWDNVNLHPGVGPNSDKSEVTNQTGYAPKQTIMISPSGYSDHIASTNEYSADLYIVANDGNIYEFNIPQSQNGMMWRPNSDMPQTSTTGVVGQITQDAAARAELSDLVGYDAEKVSQHFQYDN